MNSKALTTALLSIFGFSSCNLTSDKHTDIKAKPAFMVQKEVFRLYRKTDSIIYVARALTVNPDTVDLHLYTINVTAPEAAIQTPTSSKQVRKQEISNIKTEMQVYYNWKPFNKKDVLFIQIQPSGFKDEMQLLNKRQEIEDKLNEALENKKLG